MGLIRSPKNSQCIHLAQDSQVMELYKYALQLLVLKL
jgi:hypothetical protein